MDRVRLYLTQYQSFIIAFVLGAIVAVVGVTLWHYSQPTAVPVKIEVLKDTSKLADTLNVDTNTAKAIQKEIITTAPAITYYEPALTVKQAATQTLQAINRNDERLPKAVLAKTDKTAVVANTEQQKVDVYKINLNKAHKIKAGTTIIDNKAYATVGYQAGKFEGLAHFDTNGIKGATALYTVYEW